MVARKILYIRAQILLKENMGHIIVYNYDVDNRFKYELSAAELCFC